jgi:3-methyladenine DNA glycosylase AlkD
VPKLRNLAVIFRGKHTELSLDEVCKLMDMLCEDQCREEILFGIFLLSGYGKKIIGLNWDRMDKWIEALDNWETCDQLASNMSGPLVAANLVYVDHLVELTRSGNLWKRRFAVATVSELNHKGRLYSEESFRVCHPLLGDPEPMVWKAVGWAIREISKKDEAAAFTFLSENKQQIPIKLLREASEKLSPQNRQRILS